MGCFSQNAFLIDIGSVGFGAIKFPKPSILFSLSPDELLLLDDLDSSSDSLSLEACHSTACAEDEADAEGAVLLKFSVAVDFFVKCCSYTEVEGAPSAWSSDKLKPKSEK